MTSPPVPPYLMDHDSASLFTRLQRVGIHLELLQREAMADLDISFGDFVILATLRREPKPHELAVSQIAGYILRPMGSISQALDRIERDGLVERTHDRNDRRRVNVTLTADGKSVVERAQLSYEAVRRRVFDDIDEHELESIDTALRTLLVSLDTDYGEHNT